MVSSGSDHAGSSPEPATARTVRLHLLVVTRALLYHPGPAGEVGYATGLSADPRWPGWLRLALFDTNEFGPYAGFTTYDVISVDAAGGADPPDGWWRPEPRTVRRQYHLKRWQPRRAWLDAYVEDSMCRLERATRLTGSAQPVALVRVHEVVELEVTAYSNGVPAPARALPRPRFRGAYHYRCPESSCPGHRQDIVDWEFVALQRRLADLPDARLRAALATIFHDRLCAGDRDLAFYVGPGGIVPTGFAVTGAYWPPRH